MPRKSGGHQSHGTTCGKHRCQGDCHGSVRAQESEEALGNSTPSACSCPRWGGSGRKSGDAAAGCAARQAPTHDRRARGHLRHLPRDHPAVRVAVPLPRTRPPPTSASRAQLSAAAQDVTPPLATSFLEAARHPRRNSQQRWWWQHPAGGAWWWVPRRGALEAGVALPWRQGVATARQ